MYSSLIEAVVSVVVEDVDCCRLLWALQSYSFVEAVESVVVEAVESVVKPVDCCRLLCTLV